MPKNLLEAARSVLSANLQEDANSVLEKSRGAHADSFGAGTSLKPGGPQVIDLYGGQAHTKTTDAFPDFTRGVPTATPPGATPPVGSEAMPKLKPQPQQSMGHGENSGIEGKEGITATTAANRGTNVTPKVTPGTGMKLSGFSEDELFTDQDLEDLLNELEGLDEGSKEAFKKMIKDKMEGKKKGKKEADCKNESVDLSKVISDLSTEILSGHHDAISEDINAIFLGETLSEEFKTKASTIFEAAIASRFNELVGKLDELFNTKLSEAIESIQGDLSESVNDYLNYMVEEWVKENEIAIEKGLRAEIVEDFITGLRNLFVENYIDIPEEKLDVVTQLTDKVEELQTGINEEIRRGVELRKQLNEVNKNSMLHSICEGLTQTQAAKIRSLAEGVEFTNDADFKTKLSVLKESYFPSTKVVVPGTESLDTSEPLLQEGVVTNDPIMQAYVKTISNLKK